jgi:hypothetical protein
MSEADLMTPAPPPRLVAAPKPKLTIYVVLLILSLAAILMGCLFLYLEIRGQGGFGTVHGNLSSVQPPARTLLAAAPHDYLPAAG